MIAWSPGLVHEIARFNLGVQMARQAYEEDPSSTHKQRDDYTKEQAREHEADASRRG